MCTSEARPGGATLRVRGGGCAGSKAEVAPEMAERRGLPSAKQAQRPAGGESRAAEPGSGAAARRLSAASLEEATARYTGVGALRGLLTHDAALGGVPIKLLSARWVLDFFQAAANASARLEHRQALEREHPEAFVAGGAVERLLAEVERGVCVAEAPGGGCEALQRTNNYYGVKGEVEVFFPGVVAMSHMWLDPSHPDPAARNLREMWLPAIEWYYSERVRQLADPQRDRAEDASGAALSDEAVRAAADFGLFVDLASMCQKEGGARTPAEDALFRHALGSLDVVYAHARTASFLSTRLPEGAGVGRGYDDRGWTCFERAEGELIKPDSRCIDIGLFTVDKAFERADTAGGQEGVRIGGAPCAERTVEELARQGSYDGGAGNRGLLGDLVGARRGAPLSPEAFGEVLGTKTFTNDADAGGVLELYRKTATALLGSARKLKYEKLEWGAADYAHLGGALRYCGALESLALENMGLGDADAAAVLAGEPPALKELVLVCCESLTALPDLSALASLQTLNLKDCSSLTALPDLSARKELEVKNVPGHASAWEEGGFKAWSRATQ